MRKFFLSSFILASIIFTQNIAAQDSNSIQINGGIIRPMSSSKGLSASAQYNFSLNPNIQLYVYSGYSAWDQYKLVFREDYSPIQKKTFFKSFSADEHILIPVYIGGKLNLRTNKLFTSFVTFELGYSYLSYNSYKIEKEINHETGEVLSYHPNSLTKKKIEENLFGFGIGAGILHPMTKNVNLIFSFKLNSYLNSKYYGLFSTRGTYTTFMAGFNYSI